MIRTEADQSLERDAEETELDLESFDSLFRTFHPRLVRFLSKQLEGTSVDPEDVAQDSMVKVWSKRDQFDRRYQFSTWVYTIARRTATDHLRRRRPTESLQGHEFDAQETHHHELTALTDEFASVWRAAERFLNKSQYSALWLRYGEEMSIKEVSQALSKSTVSVRVLLHRARAILQTQLVAKQDSPASSEASR